jgi:ribosomal protein S12 methylthiotransferase
LRGKHHSRSIAGIVDEVRQLVSHGTKEVVFIAQDLTSYGRDRSDGASLLSLLAEIEAVDGLEWYRLMYNYPRFFTDELIDLLASSRKFSGYLDIPFQHISDPVLKLMNRPESSQEIKSLVQKLRSRIPGIFLRTTVMVGFPGETDENFNDLLNFVRESSFDHLGAFTYWREEGTPSHDLPNQVEDEIKKRRYSLLMKSQQKLSKEKLKGFLGRVLDVRVDALSEAVKDGFVYRGRHRGQAPEVDGLTYVFSERKVPVGVVVKAEINKIVGDYDLLGRALIPLNN